jgi:hypothetical protein
MEIRELIFKSFNTALGCSLVGQLWGVDAGVGFCFGLISFPITEVSSTLLRTTSHTYTLTPNGEAQESTLDLIRSVVIPMFLGSLAAWGTLAVAGFPLSFTSCLILTAGDLIWNIFTDAWKDWVRAAYGYGPDA